MNVPNRSTKMFQEIANVCMQPPVRKLLKKILVKKKKKKKTDTGAISVFVQPNFWAMASAQWYI